MSNQANIFNFIIFILPYLHKFKKHVAEDHCKYFNKNHTNFYKKWKGNSGIYKITFLPFRLFTYYGSSKDLGLLFKYHYFNTPKEFTFLGLFIKTFGWECFSVTVVELVKVNKLTERENWYLKTFMPILNILTKSKTDPRKIKFRSAETKYKIS